MAEIVTSSCHGSMTKAQSFGQSTVVHQFRSETNPHQLYSYSLRSPSSVMCPVSALLMNLGCGSLSRDAEDSVKDVAH